MSERRVVVTGLGAVSPIGLTANETWTNALNGKSGAGKITLFDTKDCACQIACEVKDYDVTRQLGPFTPRPDQPDKKVEKAADRKDAKKMGRFIHFALSAGLEAYGDSGLDTLRDKVDPNRFGVNIGVGMGGLPEIEHSHEKELLAKGFKRITPFLIPQIIANMGSGQLSILLNLRGPNVCNVTACSSSAHSLGESMHMIKRGDADIMLAGGAESVVSPVGIGSFANMRALSTRNDEPEKASRPFDEGRDGFVMGEGAAALVLEEFEHAKKRGAKIYGELVGYGLSGDGYHMTLPSPDGEGGGRAMQMALGHAKVDPDKIGYVNAHGTSTPAGDVEEVKAVKRLLPNGPEKTHISSTKSMTGHLLGAAGALEGFFCVMAVKEGRIPPTINLDNLDPGCKELGFDYTANSAAEKPLEYALSNSFGFGGTNACLIVGRV